jgi:hypothetical protein
MHAKKQLNQQGKWRMGAVRSNFRGDREDMHQVIRGIN